MERGLGQRPLRGSHLLLLTEIGVVMVPRVAVLVDAGYLYAEGVKAIRGGNPSRNRTFLDHPTVVSKLRALADEKAYGAPLLRIYWYDGARSRRGPSQEQTSLADADNVKLRLGVVTAYGRQKGVDSLIVTDLVGLARNGSISDAVLLSGDEDIRIGVEIAQSFGVRVHLLGIESSGGNQSRALMQEADTKTEWSASDIGEFLTLKTKYAAAPEPETAIGDMFRNDPEKKTALDEAAKDLIANLEPNEIRLIADLAPNDWIPNEYDVRLRHRGYERTGARLSRDEKIYLRAQLKAAARDSAAAATDSTA